ncbi:MULTISPECIES: hypothetical protein [unclassified Streptomyces]|uniref:hypothetical protein n=1 Tax=unclassified Streptomyces TaxID=2593676 RepID=UPI002474494F|nr:MULTISPECIES: hypothetical protein [unclassified Streptomyces]MDH6451105.1 hypothetical protein [Streptomyces sp. SAI-119]MDH6498340.1 hypothetical protein [Streptomyces sp. SAI-149]
MEEIFELGDISCPSGILVVIDGGHLGLWSGERSPAEIDPALLGIDDAAVADDVLGAVDFAVVGPDAAAATVGFGRRPGVFLHDIPASRATELGARFEAHCLAAGLDAHLEALPGREPHAHRVRRTAAGGGGGFLMFGVPVVAVGGVPRDRYLPVSASRVEFGDGTGPRWSEMSVRMSNAPVESSVPLGDVGVDWARLLFGDADALNAWQHEEPVDGLADVAFWGAAADTAATVFGASELGEPGEEGVRGWSGLAVPEAMEKARALLRWKEESGSRMAVDFRPHSHHWQVMRQVRASDVEAGTVDVGGARLLCTMTSWGDGCFPVFADLDPSGALVAVRVRFSDLPR